jgi:hypothetical protein
MVQHGENGLLSLHKLLLSRGFDFLVLENLDGNLETGIERLKSQTWTENGVKW